MKVTLRTPSAVNRSQLYSSAPSGINCEQMRRQKWAVGHWDWDSFILSERQAPVEITAKIFVNREALITAWSDEQAVSSQHRAAHLLSHWDKPVKWVQLAGIGASIQEAFWLVKAGSAQVWIINSGFIPLSVPVSRVSMSRARALELAHLNGFQPLFMLLIPPVLFLLWQAKISSVKKVYWLHCGHTIMLNTFTRNHCYTDYRGALNWIS